MRLPRRIWIMPSTSSCRKSSRQDKAPTVLDMNPGPTWNTINLIAQHHPNLIVIELGDAMAGYGERRMDGNFILDQVHALTGQIAASHISCDWVGPTWGHHVRPARPIAH